MLKADPGKTELKFNPQIFAGYFVTDSENM